MLHTETQMSIPTQYHRVCSPLCTVAAGARAVLMQPSSNRDQERQKYYTLLQIAQGGHHLPCSTMHYGQVQKKQWIQLNPHRHPPVISQRSEEGQGILCAKKVTGKYDMWYGVVCR
jgi:hypothetical protein